MLAKLGKQRTLPRIIQCSFIQIKRKLIFADLGIDMNLSPEALADTK